MKKIIKVILITLSSITLIFSVLIFTFLILPTSTKLDLDKLSTQTTCKYYDKNNIEIEDNFTNSNVEYEELPQNLIDAFVVQEDKNFFTHNGIDVLRIIKAFFVNVFSLSYKQGGSTITQQLVKNTLLTSEKTIKRKIDEIKLAMEVEKVMSKEEILTKYLNTIYFGQNSYGIESASKKYFNKKTSELNLSECATLASIVSSPSKINPISNLDKSTVKRNNLLDKMQNLGYISENEKTNVKNSKIDVSIGQVETSPYVIAVENELNNILSYSPYQLNNYKVYTYYDDKLQNQINNNLSNCDYQQIVLDNNSLGVLAYYSTCGEIEREIASTAKPFVVYAPAFDKNMITENTIIDDKKITFGGYTPSNFGDKYLGNISIKDALKLSQNIPAIKVLDSLGIDKAKTYCRKMGLNIENDNLAIALGSFGKGVTLKDLSSYYSVFANNGYYKKPHFIKKIIDNYDNIIYQENATQTQVFNESTTNQITDILCECAKCGTGKKLNNLPFNVACKTGTNGNDNGNYDAYSIAYTTDITLAVWLGNKDYSTINYLGGGLPTAIINQTLSKYYEYSTPKDFEYNCLTSIDIDKYEYENNGDILIADEYTPDIYKTTLKFPINNMPTKHSTLFTTPTIENVNVNCTNNRVDFKLQKNSLIEYDLHLSNGSDNTLLYSGDKDFSVSLSNGVYDFFIIPKIKTKYNEYNYGDMIKLKRIKIMDRGNSIH